LDGFGEMFRGHVRRFIKVGHGASDFENSVVSASGKAHAADGHFEGALAGIIEGADGADLAGGYAGVLEAACLLHRARLLDPGANIGRRLGGGGAAQFFERQGGDLNVNIDAVEQGSTDLAEIVLDLTRGTAALARGIAKKAAFAPVQIPTATEY
jgi:hypothetical protein